jgi:CHAD domain-containing protein
VSFNWADYLTVADKVAGMVEGDHELAEGYYRTAISRAYYAAFNIAKQALPERLSKRCPKGAGAHKYVKRQYENGEAPDQRAVGDDLHRLRIARNKADYYPEWGDAGKQCAAGLGMARRTIECVKSHPL